MSSGLARAQCTARTGGRYGRSSWHRHLAGCSAQWQQSMFPRGGMGWRMATTAVTPVSPAGVVAPSTAATSDRIAIAATMTRRRRRETKAMSFTVHSFVRQAGQPAINMDRSRRAPRDTRDSRSMIVASDERGGEPSNRTRPPSLAVGAMLPSVSPGDWWKGSLSDTPLGDLAPVGGHGEDVGENEDAEAPCESDPYVAANRSL
jgi:hypothetical protein